MICALSLSQIISLIAIPVLISVLVLALVMILSSRNKTDTLAVLAYELQNLIALCKTDGPDLKTLKKAEAKAAKCTLLSDRAAAYQRQDIGNVPENIAAARKIISALADAETPPEDCNRFLALALGSLENAYGFLIVTLGITAAPQSAPLAFFSSGMKSKRAKKYLDSIDPEKDGHGSASDE